VTYRSKSNLWRLGGGGVTYLESRLLILAHINSYFLLPETKGKRGDLADCRLVPLPTNSKFSRRFFVCGEIATCGRVEGSGGNCSAQGYPA